MPLFIPTAADKAKLETKDIDSRIMEMVKNNRHITRQKIADTLGVSVKTIERHLKNLPVHFSASDSNQ